MTPHEIELYTTSNDEVQLSVHRDEDGFVTAFWLTSGIASISYSPEQFEDLMEMLVAYKEEEMDAPKTPNPLKIAATILLIALVGALLFILLGT